MGHKERLNEATVGARPEARERLRRAVSRFQGEIDSLAKKLDIGERDRQNLEDKTISFASELEQLFR